MIVRVNGRGELVLVLHAGNSTLFINPSLARGSNWTPGRLLNGFWHRARPQRYEVTISEPSALIMVYLFIVNCPNLGLVLGKCPSSGLNSEILFVLFQKFHIYPN